jgi:hypothetical protein
VTRSRQPRHRDRGRRSAHRRIDLAAVVYEAMLARGSTVSRVRAAKSDLLATLSTSSERPGSEEAREHDRGPSPHRTIGPRIIEWLDQHPTPSRPGYCAWCGRPGSPSAVVLPFGTEPETHAWLHSECWPDWHRARKAEAAKALAPNPGGSIKF